MEPTSINHTRLETSPPGPQSFGRHLVATTAHEPGNIVLRIDRLAVQVLESKEFFLWCEWCIRPRSDSIRRPDPESPEHRSEAGVLQVCKGCNLARYCSTACQTASWRHHHKYECEIFGRLYPRYLPSTVRIGMQILLRKAAGNMPAELWNAVVGLQDHRGELEALATTSKERAEELANVQLMARATREFSRAKAGAMLIELESKGFDVVGLLCRLLINGMGLTSPTLHPIGLNLSPAASYFTHSCHPNLCATFDGPALIFRAMRQIPANAILTVSYLSTSLLALPPRARQRVLSTRWYFTCRCEYCAPSNGNAQTFGQTYPPDSIAHSLASDGGAEAVRLKVSRMLGHTDEEASDLATGEDGNAESDEHFDSAKRAHKMLRESGWPAWLAPLPGLRIWLQEMSMARGYHLAAFLFAVESYSLATKVMWPESGRPERVIQLLFLTNTLEEVLMARVSKSSQETKGYFGLKALLEQFGLNPELIDGAWYAESAEIARLAMGADSLMAMSSLAARKALDRFSGVNTVDYWDGPAEMRSAWREQQKQLEKLAIEGWAVLEAKGTLWHQGADERLPS